MDAWLKFFDMDDEYEKRRIKEDMMDINTYPGVNFTFELDEKCSSKVILCFKWTWLLQGIAGSSLMKNSLYSFKLVSRLS